MKIRHLFPGFNSSIKKIEFNPWTKVMLVLGIFTLICYGIILYHAIELPYNPIRGMLIPLVLGIIYEDLRLKTDWGFMVFKISGALFFSLIVFLPGKNEPDYLLVEHLAIWPYYFIGSFLLFSVAHHDKKLVPKLTEGITMLQSLSLIYWIIDLGVLELRGPFYYIILPLGSAFIVISLIHAFTYLPLTKHTRLFLSIWSSVVMILFAIDHIYRVFKFNALAKDPIFNLGLNALQYFLLGMALIYMLQNFFMIMIYLPGRNQLYDKSHLREIKKTNKLHLWRYASDQVKIKDATLALCFTGIVYWMNHEFQLLPRHTMIWVVFASLPVIIKIKNQWKSWFTNKVSL